MFRRHAHVDLTTDEQETGGMVQSVVAESMLQSSPEAPPYSPLSPQNEWDLLAHIYSLIITRNYCKIIDTLPALLHSLASMLLGENLYITVRRSHFLQDALWEGHKTKFNPKMQIRVSFVHSCMCAHTHACMFVCTCMYTM